MGVGRAVRPGRSVRSWPDTRHGAAGQHSPGLGRHCCGSPPAPVPGSTRQVFGSGTSHVRSAPSENSADLGDGAAARKGWRATAPGIRRLHPRSENPSPAATRGETCGHSPAIHCHKQHFARIEPSGSSVGNLRRRTSGMTSPPPLAVRQVERTTSMVWRIPGLADRGSSGISRGGVTAHPIPAPYVAGWSRASGETPRAAAMATRSSTSQRRRVRSMRDSMVLVMGWPSSVTRAASSRWANPREVRTRSMAPAVRSPAGPISVALRGMRLL